MAKRFKTQNEIDAFLETPRLAMLLYNGPHPAPTGVPVWFDWDGKRLRMFAGRTSPKVARLKEEPHASVLVTNQVREPEGWVAFDGLITISDFEAEDWQSLIDRVAPRYWDLSDPGYKQEIEGWRASPESFVSLELEQMTIRSGA